VMAWALRWVPVQFPTDEFERKVAEQPVRQSVSEIEELISGDNEVRWVFPAEVQRVLQTMYRRETEFAVFSTRASVAAILGEIRNQILRWSVALDKAGIRGDGLTFTPQEKATAHSIIVHGAMNVSAMCTHRLTLLLEITRMQATLRKSRN
jgi:hypothetical protein